MSTLLPRPDAPDHGAARAPARCFDLAPLAVLDITGPDAATFLQGQLSNDVQRLGSSTWQWTTYNSPKGRVLANFLLWGIPGGFRALVDGALAESLRKRLAMFVLRAKVAIADASAGTRRLGWAGEDARQRLHETLGTAPDPGAIARAGEVEILGLPLERFVILAPAAQAADVEGRLGPACAPYAEWMWRMIRAGEPLVGPATQDQFVLQTANLDVLGAVRFDKGCYTGQEIVARMQYLGRLKERLFGFHLAEGPADPGTRLYSQAFGDQAAGTVVNSAAAPEGGTDLLAVVQLAAATAEVHVGAPDGPVLAPFALPYAIPAPSTPRRP